MKYKSTRGDVTGRTFEEALFTGYAADGGLILPETIPKIDLNELKSWAKPSYVELAKKIIPLYVDEDEIPSSDLRATSGDTGSSAIEAVREQKWVDIVMLFPRGRISQIQELQMTSVIEDNVHVFRVDGSVDDLDAPIKQCFRDHAFTKRHNLSSINSINWARIMMCPTCDEVVQIVIPTGALGNMTSGIYAKEMGVQLEFVCTVTQNDVVARTIQTGNYAIADHVVKTLANVMDIQIPYNMERIWYILTGGNCSLIKNLMAEFEDTGSVLLPNEIKETVRRVIVDTVVVSDEEIRQTIKRTWDTHSYLVCPHTATGVIYHYQQFERNAEEMKARVIIATASVIKFEEALLSAAIPFTRDPRVSKLFESKQRYKDMHEEDNWLKLLQDKIEDIDRNRIQPKKKS